MNKNLISVIIPVYNGEKYIAAALESIFNQTYQSFEVIVVDDGSSDQTQHVVEQFKAVRHCRQANEGVSSALNKGIALAQGNFFAFLDADDVWSAHKLELQMQVFSAHEEMDIVFTHLQQMLSPELSQQVIGNFQTVQAGYHRGTMLIKREAFFSVGRFDQQLKMGEFIDWYLKARALHLKVHMLPDILMQRRIHGTNMGIVQRNNRTDYLKAAKMHLASKRKMML